MTAILFGLFGLAVLIGIAWIFSSNRRGVDWKLVLTGLSLQIAFALFVLVTPWGETVFRWISAGFVALLGFTSAGATLIFGDLGTSQHFGFIFAFQVLPTIVFFAAFMSVLYHLGVMQTVVKSMAWVIMKVMRVSGAETLSVCANAFIGQTEAPLVVKPYIAGMTRSELLCLMVGGMATIAGGVMAAYVQMLGGGDPESQRQFAKHLLTASIMAAPAALLIAKVMVPETETPQTAGSVTVPVEKTATNVIDAAAAGASDGLKLALNVGAMLLAFTALIAMLNGVIGGLADTIGLTRLMNPGVDPRCLADAAFAVDPANACQVSRLSLSLVLGWILAPLAWVIGVPWEDATTVGGLIGTKIVLNEFIAYGALSDILAGNVAGVTLAPISVLIATYALCGFANFSSIAIQLGGIGGIAPERRADLARFGLRAVLGGSLATMMTATIAGVISQL